MSAKRIATSPIESSTKRATSLATAVQMTTMPPKKPTSSKDNPDGSLFRYEVIGQNDKRFYGSLSECEILHIWEKVLGRGRDEIYAMSYNRSLTRNFKVTIKLNAVLVPKEVYPEPNFVYYRKAAPDAPDEDDVAIHCKIIGYDDEKPVELGKLHRITAKTNDFTVKPAEIQAWLSKFGTVSSKFDYVRNSAGLRSDIFETEIALNRHVPEYLPIAGRKVQIYYPGIPRSCNNCYQEGHVKRNCKSKKIDWLQRVIQIRQGGQFEDELFGGWIALIERQ
jgi:hypothetical protein